LTEFQSLWIAGLEDYIYYLSGKFYVKEAILFLESQIFIPNIYLGLGFEFGPKRIRDLASVCP
jgi:hypothetical protein